MCARFILLSVEQKCVVVAVAVGVTESAATGETVELRACRVGGWVGVHVFVVVCASPPIVCTSLPI